MKWTEERAPQKLNWKLSAKKNEYTSGNKIYTENLRKLRMDQSRKLLEIN